MKDSYTKVHYDDAKKPYTRFPVLLSEHLAENYLNSKKGRILDVCCGRGEFLKIFGELGFDPSGVDIDSVAGEKGFSLRVADVDKEDIPYEDDTFDFVIAKSAIEHIRNIYHLMENMRRVLKPGGKILLLTSDWKKNYRIFFDDVDHKTPFTIRSLGDLLRRYDFMNVKAEHMYYLPFTWKNSLFKIVPELISALYPFDISPDAKLTPINKLLRFSRERQVIACGQKPGEK